MSEAPSFEEAYARLRETVDLLEAGERPLEEMLDLYEQGMRLVALCAGQLEQAELRLNEIDSALGEALAALDPAHPDAADDHLPAWARD